MNIVFLFVLTLLMPVVHAETVKVDDISIKYNKIGQGEPIVLISGTGNPLDFWPRKLLEKLAENHTVITFDNRGIGNSTMGDKKFTIKQFARDTDLFLSKLNITRTHILGYSLGGMIAQELALFSNKIDQLIIASSHCGGKQMVPASKEVINILNDTKLTPTEKKQELRSVIYPKGFELPKSSEIVTDKAILLQQKAIAEWEGTCDRLKDINLETLVIVGKNDNFTPPLNSLLISKYIKGAWLIQTEGGHGTSRQDSKYADIILLFLSR